MKKFLIFIFLSTVVSSINLYSQSGWFLQQTGTKEPINSIYFINSNTGFALASSMILKTTNGGNNWSISLKIKGYAFGFLSIIQFVNENTGYAISQTYQFKTTNCGLNWDTKIENTNVYWVTYSFPDAFTGYKLDSSLSKTTNGGDNWFPINIPENKKANSFTSICFTNNENGIITSNNEICRTSDGGWNWSCSSDINYEFIDKLFSVNDSVIYMLSGGKYFGSANQIFKTTNKGLNWINIWKDKNSTIYTLSFIDANTGYAIGFYIDSLWQKNPNIILKTTDGGLNWNKQSFKINIERNRQAMDYDPFLLMSIFFVNDNTGYIGGDWGYILKTTTGGE